MPSARSRRLLGVGLVVLAAGPLAGCTTTQETAARLQLNDARLRDTQNAVKVTQAQRSTSVTVTRLSTLNDRGRTAFLVTIHNAGRATADLPISVGYTHGRQTTYLNGAAGADYFTAHLPRIGARATVSWVDVVSKKLPVGARAFANIGATPSPAAPAGSSPVSVSASYGSSGASPLVVHLKNQSGIPQYQLPVYAYAVQNGQLEAAGTTTVTTLAAGASQTVKVPLLGRAGTAVTVEALPTIVN